MNCIFLAHGKAPNVVVGSKYTPMQGARENGQGDLRQDQTAMPKIAATELFGNEARRTGLLMYCEMVEESRVIPVFA
jgi:hypothetical protein